MMFVSIIVSMPQALSFSAFAATSGTCGENLSWTFDDTRTLTISGTGDMPNFYPGYRDTPWDDLYISHVVVTDGVTSIGNYAFYGCSVVKTVSIADSVKSIGDMAFGLCYDLTDIEIPDSVISIGDSAFYSCSDLKNVTLSASLTTMGNGVFTNDHALKNIVLPDSLESVGIGCFGNTGIKSIEIPASLTTIIVTKNTGPFTSNYSLESITVHPDNSAFCSIDGVLYNKDVTRLICYPSRKQGTSYVIPEGVTEIDYYAFDHCLELESVIIPSGVTALKKNTIHDYTNLKSVEIPVSVTAIASFAFNKGPYSDNQELTDIYYCGTIEQWEAIELESPEFFNDLTIHFAEEPASVTVTYDANGGIDAPQPQIKLRDAALTLTSDIPSREGLTFTGWNTKADGSGTKYYPEDQYTINNSRTLYAQWGLTGELLPIQFHLNDGSDEVIEKAYALGNRYGEFPEVSSPGLTFAGWYTNSNWEYGSRIESEYTVKPSSATSLYARWEEIYYTVTFQSNGGVFEEQYNPHVTETQRVTYTRGMTPPSSSSLSRTGYNFIGWFTEPDGGNEYTGRLFEPSDLTVYAHWEPAEFDVRCVYRYPDEVGYPNTWSYRAITQGATFAEISSPLSNPVSHGHDFNGWYDANGNKVDDNTIADYSLHHELYGYFTPKTFTITFDYNNGSGTVITRELVYGETYDDIPMPEKYGYELDGWGVYAIDGVVDESYNSSHEVVHIENGTPFKQFRNMYLKATWTPTIFKTITLDPNGGTCDRDCYEFTVDSEYYSDDGHYPMLPIPKKGDYNFLGWYTAKEGGQKAEGYHKYLVSGDHTLYAHWGGYPITFHAADGEFDGSKNEITLELMPNDNFIEVPTPTKEGYTFTGWSYSQYNSAKKVSQPLRFYIENGYRDFYAIWEQNFHTIHFDPCGGTVTPTSKEYGGNNSIINMPEPTRDGYKFKGWYTSAVGGEKAWGMQMPDHDITLYAQWTRIVTVPANNSADSSSGEATEVVNTVKKENSDGTVTEYSIVVVVLGSNGTKIPVGSSALTQAMVLPYETANQAITWKSSNASVAKVNSSGTITGVTPGKATITATSQTYGVSVSIEVTVVFSFKSIHYSFKNTYGSDGFNYLYTYEWSWKYLTNIPVESYKIPLSNFTYMYGNTSYAKSLYENQGTWGGNCHGMVTTSALMNVPQQSGQYVSLYTGSNGLVSSIKNRNGGWRWIQARNFIEQMQVAQRDSVYSSRRGRTTNNLNALVSATKNSIEKGYPMEIGIWGAQGGHSIMPYKITYPDSFSARIYVYDPNYPYDNNRFIRLRRDGKNNYYYWSYPINSSITWGSGKKNSAIRYISFENILYLWNNRGSLNGNLQVAYSFDYNVADNTGKYVVLFVENDVDIIAPDGSVLSVRNGDVTINDISDTVIADNSGVVIENEGAFASDAPLCIYLPADEYQVIGVDGNDIDVEVVDLHTSIDVTATPESTITINATGDNPEKIVTIENKYGEADSDDCVVTFSFDDESNGTLDEVAIAGSTVLGTSTYGISDDGVVASGLDDLTVSAQYDSSLAETPDLVTFNSDASDILVIDNFTATESDVAVYEDVDEDGDYETKLGEADGSCIVTEIKLDCEELTMSVGDTATLNATLLPAEHIDSPEVMWSTSDESVATVSEDGKITAVGGGYTNICASCDEFIYAYCTVFVEQDATGIAFNESSITMELGSTETPVLTLSPIDATSEIVWKSSNEDVATVDDNGEVSAVGLGNATITASADGFSTECDVLVEVSMSAFMIDPEELTLSVGGESTISAIVLPIGATTEGNVVWESSNPECVTVENGKVQGISTGTATVTATIDGLTASCAVTVTEITVELDKSILSLEVGETSTLTATVTPEILNSTVSWKSSDSSVVTVDESGKITAIGAGTATITATVGSCSVSCTVTVGTEVINYDVTPNINGGASKLYEPWGLRYFAAYNGDDIDKIADYGIAILKDAYYTDGMIAEEFCANKNAHVYLDSKGELGFEAASTNNPNGRYYATLTEGIYSYDISAYYYVVPFAVMENGQTVYGTIKKNSMEKILNTNLNLTSITAEEKAICTCILDLKESVAAHYAASGVPGASIDMEIPRGSSQNVAASTATTTQSGITPNIVAGASRLIEPWGLRYFATYTDSDSIADRGVVILCEKYFDSSYKTSQDKMRLNTNSYVFTESNGTLLYDEGSGRYYATVTEGISSKDIADVYYVVPYVVLDNGSYVYGTVKQNSMMKIMNTNLNIASVSETEKEVSRDIIALYEAVQAYYAA